MKIVPIYHFINKCTTTLERGCSIVDVIIRPRDSALRRGSQAPQSKTEQTKEQVEPKSTRNHNQHQHIFNKIQYHNTVCSSQWACKRSYQNTAVRSPRYLKDKKAQFISISSKSTGKQGEMPNYSGSCNESSLDQTMISR